MFSFFFFMLNRQQFDKTFENITDLKPAISVYLSVKKLLNYWDPKRDRHRFEKLSRYIARIHLFMNKVIYFFNLIV